MKKIVSVLLLCAMVLTLTACGNSSQEPEAPQQSAHPETPAAPETPAVPEQPSILPAQPDQNVITAPDTTTKVDPTVPQTPTESETPAEPEAPAESETPVEPAQTGTDLAALVDQIYAIKMPEFMLMTMPVDLTDADSTAWLTGVSDPALLKGAVVSESMMGAQAYSLVLAQVADAARAEEVAGMMLQNIDPVKWICVQADDIDAGIKGDLVLFVMIDSQFGIPAADFIGAFKTIAGGNLDKELSK